MCRAWWQFCDNPEGEGDFASPGLCQAAPLLFAILGIDPSIARRQRLDDPVGSFIGSPPSPQI
jgi:hypothetical protein